VVDDRRQLRWRPESAHQRPLRAEWRRSGRFHLAAACWLPTAARHHQVKWALE